MHYVTSDELGSVYGVAVPCHVFALVMYLCGGKAPLACTAVVALLGCGLCVVLYRFARLLGADERAAFRLLVLTAFLPGFLLHTSDMFKDGFNAFLVVACLGLAVSNLRRFDLLKVVALGPLLWALWNVRPYMVFMCSLPLLAGVTRVKRALSGRSLVVFAVVLIPVLVLLQGIDQNDGPLGTMQAQLDRGQSQHTRLANAEGGVGGRLRRRRQRVERPGTEAGLHAAVALPMGEREHGAPAREDRHADLVLVDLLRDPGRATCCGATTAGRS